QPLFDGPFGADGRFCRSVEDLTRHVSSSAVDSGRRNHAVRDDREQRAGILGEHQAVPLQHFPELFEGEAPTWDDAPLQILKAIRAAVSRPPVDLSRHASTLMSDREKVQIALWGLWCSLEKEQGDRELVVDGNHGVRDP